MINVVDDYLKFVESSLYTYYRILLGKNYEKSLVSPFVEKYIDVRYYNNTGYHTSRNFLERTTRDLKNIVSNLIDQYPDKEETIKNIFALFAYILYFDDVSEYTSVSALLKSLFTNELIKISYDFETEESFKKFIYEFLEKKEKYFKLFDVKEFRIKTKRIKRYMSFVSLEQFCNISQLYSTYAIDKAYNGGVVLENKYYLLYILLSHKVLQDVRNLDFNIKYVVDFPTSLFEKSKKINKYLKVLDNDICKERIHLYFHYQDYIEHKDMINKFISMGYSIDVELDEFFKDDYNSLVLFSNVFVYEKFDYYDMIIDSKDSIKANVITL